MHYVTQRQQTGNTGNFKQALNQLLFMSSAINVLCQVLGVSQINVKTARPPQDVYGQMDVLQSLHIQGPGADKLTIDGNIRWLDANGNVNSPYPDSPGSFSINVSGLVFEVGIFGEDNSGLNQACNIEALIEAP